MSRAAIYLRVSTDEQASGADEQERGALVWCERNGHTVARVYRDIGHSGAEWVTRPAVLELQADAERDPRPFDLVVVRDVDRLGRDAFRLPMLLATLRENDIGVTEYSTGRAVELDGVGVIVANVLAAVAQVERENIARRVRGALAGKASRGLHTGGRCYGYTNVRGDDGVRYGIDEAEAAIVREIYERRAAGESCRSIAVLLNARGVPSPRARERGTGMWGRPEVSRISMNPRYRGLATWGRVGSRYKKGTRVEHRRADAEVITYACPAIVPDELWHRAQEHGTAARDNSGRARPGPRSRYLLIGLALCGLCGGRVTSGQTSRGTGEKRVVVPAYCCARHKDSGLCDARYLVPLARFDQVITDWLADDVLDAARVARAFEEAREIVRAPRGVDPRARELDALESDLAARASRVRRAIQASDDDGLIGDLRTLTRELEALRAERAHLVAPAPVVSLDAERALVARVRDLRGAFDKARSSRPEMVREVLSAVLVGRVKVTPLAMGRAATYQIDAEAEPGALLTARISNAPTVAVGVANAPVGALGRVILARVA